VASNDIPREYSRDFNKAQYEMFPLLEKEVFEGPVVDSGSSVSLSEYPQPRETSVHHFPSKDIQPRPKRVTLRDNASASVVISLNLEASRTKLVHPSRSSLFLLY
jgi:hypothetical protein